MRRARGGGLVGTLLVAAAVVGCGGAREPTPEVRDASAPALSGAPDGPELVNDAWRIVKMATAHGIFTIEVEVQDPETASDGARELIAPLEGSYDEVLVYIYRTGEGVGGNSPMKRVQWTPGGGYDELDYGGSDP